jgi:ubiquitin carboxyl-terminal hydrolase 10
MPLEKLSPNSQEDNSQILTKDQSLEILSSMPTPTQTPTSLTSDVPSDGGSTQPTTPSSITPLQSTKLQQTPTQPKGVRPVIPVIPAVPILPQSPSVARRSHRDSVISDTSKASDAAQITSDARRESGASASQDEGQSLAEQTPAEQTPKPMSPLIPHKSWADLVRSKTTVSTSQALSANAQLPNGLAGLKSESLSEVLNEMSSNTSESSAKIAFLQPRGLVNTGNMCYMNSVSSVIKV